MLKSTKIKRFSEKIARYSFIFLLTLFLSGCSLLTTKRDPGSMRIALSAAKSINPNENGKSAPLNIFIYELKNIDRFENSDYFTITGNASPGLGDSVVKVYEGILQPGEKRAIDIVPGTDTVGLGVVAAYRNINNADWSRVYKFQKPRKKTWLRKASPGYPLALRVHFNTLAISIKRMD